MAILEKENKKIERKELIQFLAENLYNILLLKSFISDPYFKDFHLSPKAIGDDLYYLTGSFYKQKGVSSWKHNMSDYITPEARDIIEKEKNISNLLVFEHMVPKSVYIAVFREATLENKITLALVYEKLEKYYHTCTVTVKQDKTLGKEKISEDKFAENLFYRYDLKEIIYHPNPQNFRVKDEEK